MQHRSVNKKKFNFVVGNPATKSDAQWEKRQHIVRHMAFANRTDAAIRTGATRKQS
jgi:hypothetical protein